MLSALAGGRIFARRHGEGPARVVALHGWGRTSADWAEVLGGLDALALDLPGFGATPAPDEAWSTQRYATEVAEVLAEVAADGSPGPFVVVGHSFGGRVALHLAAEHPELVGALVLTGVPNLAPATTSTGARPALSYRLVRWAHRRGLVSDDRMERLRRQRGSADYRAAEGVLRDVLVMAVNERYDTVVPRITAPTELVWGERDTAAPPAQARWAVEHLPDATLTVLDGIDHFTPTKAPGGLRAAVERRLSALGTGGAS